MYCAYYTARVDRKRCWLLTSILRGTEHIAFDRCLDPKESIFEFFVAPAMEPVFLELMAYCKKEAIISDCVAGTNRLEVL